MKCANCGNKNKDTLIDDGKKIYCQECCWRTKKFLNRLNVMKCHYCGHKTDKDAAVCMWCSNNPRCFFVKRKEKKYAKETAKEARKYITKSDIRYWKFY